MRKLFLRAVLITILSSCFLTALGVGAYGALELSRSAAASRDLVFQDVEKRYRIFGRLLEIAYDRMRHTAETALLEFERRYAGSESVFSVPSPELRELARSLGVDELYVLDADFIVRAASLMDDIGLDLDQGRQAVFGKLLSSVLGSGEIQDHGLSLSLRTSRINGYFYYSPRNSNFVLETSISADTVLNRVFGESFYGNFLADLFIPLQTPSGDVYGADLFLFNGRKGVSFLGNLSDPFLNPETIPRLDSGERIHDRNGWISSEYRAIPLNALPLRFVKTAYIRVSFDRQKPYIYSVHILVIVAAIAGMISLISFYSSKPFYEIHFLKRLETLSRKIDAVANGDYGQSFQDPRSDELSRIGSDIEGMVSGIVRNEERLRNAQRAELVALFSGGLAHDFNNLLNTVAGAASLLEDRSSSAPPELEKEIRESAALIKSASLRAGAMTRDLLSLSKGGETRTRVPLDIGSLLSGVSRLFARSLPPTVRFDSGPFPSGVFVLGDDSRLRQLFLNLLINAAQAVTDSADATPAGTGRIRISSSVLRNDAPAAEPGGLPAKHGKICEIQILDDGPGIDPEVREQIFKPFYTTKNKGMGVGLAMALATANAHGGDILIRNPASGAGVVFVVLLPALDPD